ncbi:MAG: hypothetical protein SGPRY_009239 [Prymnesium sp.]
MMGRRDALLAVCWICLRDQNNALRMDQVPIVEVFPALARSKGSGETRYPPVCLEPYLVELISDCALNGTE